MSTSCDPSLFGARRTRLSIPSSYRVIHTNTPYVPPPDPLLQNAPEKVVFPGHTTAQWATAVSVFAIGGPFGAILAGTVSNKRGRRGAIIVNTWIYLVGGIVFALAPNVVWLVPARFLIGFACG